MCHNYRKKNIRNKKEYMPFISFWYKVENKLTYLIILGIVLSAFSMNTNFFCNYKKIYKPNTFVTKSLKSEINITEILSEINVILPQLADFINQFNNIVNQSGINVVTDSAGNMEIDVPQNMSDSAANNVSTRIGIIDRLITTRGQEINDLFQKGMQIEKTLKSDNPNYVSQLTEKIEEFKRLNAMYKH